MKKDKIKNLINKFSPYIDMMLFWLISSIFIIILLYKMVPNIVSNIHFMIITIYLACIIPTPATYFFDPSGLCILFTACSSISISLLFFNENNIFIAIIIDFIIASFINLIMYLSWRLNTVIRSEVLREKISVLENRIIIISFICFIMYVLYAIIDIIKC